MNDQPWTPADATRKIRQIAQNNWFRITLSQHAREQLDARDLITSDVLYVLKRGFVYRNPVPSTRLGYFKYEVENLSPNGGSRSVRVVAIPDEAAIQIKVVTVMWVDEP